MLRIRASTYELQGDTNSPFIALAVTVQIVSIFVSFFKFVIDLFAAVYEPDRDLPIRAAHSLPVSFFISR